MQASQEMQRLNWNRISGVFLQDYFLKFKKKYVRTYGVLLTVLLLKRCLQRNWRYFDILHISYIHLQKIIFYSVHIEYLDYEVWEAKEVLFASYDPFCLSGIHDTQEVRSIVQLYSIL